MKNDVLSQDEIDELLFGITSEKLGYEKGAGQKFSEGKLDWTLVDWRSLEGFAKRLMCGEKKYSRDNWKKVPNAVHEYRKALLRHVFQYLNDGADLEDMDDPLMRGTTHLDAVMCCTMFLKYFEKELNND